MTGFGATDASSPSRTSAAASADPTEPWATLNRFQDVCRRLDAKYVGRERVIRLLQLGVICREHVLLLGKPGTAKTGLVAAFAGLIDAKPFRSLLTRFTEPAELFGPLDAELFRQGTYKVRTEGMLPEAELAVLDEIFQGSGAILNTLLALIGDRQFHNGAETVSVPLLSLIGTANALPTDPGLAAFTDRFLLRARVASVARDRFDDLIREGTALEDARLAAAVSANRSPGRPRATPSGRGGAVLGVADVNRLSEHLEKVDTAPVQAHYRALVHGLLKEGVELSDRRIVLGLKLVRGAALLRSATVARPADLWPLAHLWVEESDEQAVREAVRRVVDEDGGDPLERTGTPRQLVRQAEFAVTEFETAADRSPAAVEATLIRLNDVFNRLSDSHPTAAAERDRIVVLMDRVQEYLNPDPTMAPGDPGARDPGGWNV